MSALPLLRSLPLPKGGLRSFIPAAGRAATRKNPAESLPEPAPKAPRKRRRKKARPSPLPVDVIVPEGGQRFWHQLVIDRLEAEGHDVAVLLGPGQSPWPDPIRRTIEFERRLLRRRKDSLYSGVTLSQVPKTRGAALIVDLAGGAEHGRTPTLKILFDGSPLDLAALMGLLRGSQPTLTLTLDGHSVAGSALPMIDKPESAALGLDDVLARAATFISSAVRAFADERLAATGEVRLASSAAPGPARFALVYLLRALPRLARECLRRLRFRHAHWRVGYRFVEGPGVADIGALGVGWAVLPDDGSRFYADPFPFWYGTRPYVFVEDYSHAARKAVISVVSFDLQGKPRPARKVLEAPHHLSYPQVFERDGAIWMLPEASESRKLTLYRALNFPDRWVEKSVLIEDREISDATLLDHGGKLWLFATERDGHGSTSDTMVVFLADELTGPWRPHPMNPILIDRTCARPGGAFVRISERILLPVQDGTRGYGGGLGFCEVLELTPEIVRLGPARSLSTAGDFPYPQIHTLNRAGGIEVIDGIVPMPRRARRAAPVR